MKPVRVEAGAYLLVEYSRLPQKIWKADMNTESIRNHVEIYVMGADHQSVGLKSAQKHGGHWTWRQDPSGWENSTRV